MLSNLTTRSRVCSEPSVSNSAQGTCPNCPIEPSSRSTAPSPPLLKETFQEKNKEPLELVLLNQIVRIPRLLPGPPVWSRDIRWSTSMKDSLISRSWKCCRRHNNYRVSPGRWAVLPTLLQHPNILLDLHPPSTNTYLHR